MDGKLSLDGRAREGEVDIFLGLFEVVLSVGVTPDDTGGGWRTSCILVAEAGCIGLIVALGRDVLLVGVGLCPVDTDEAFVSEETRDLLARVGGVELGEASVEGLEAEVSCCLVRVEKSQA